MGQFLPHKYANLEQNRAFERAPENFGPLVHRKMGKKDKTVPENNTAAGRGETFVSHLFLG